MGSYTNAALEGFGDESYTDAALKGFGDESYTDAALKGFGDESYTNAALRGCGKFKKGSPEAKAYMAHIRSMRGKGKPPGRAGKRKLKGGVALATVATVLGMVPAAIKAAKGIYKGIKWLVRGGKDEGGFAIDPYAPPPGFAKKLGKKASGSGLLSRPAMAYIGEQMDPHKQKSLKKLLKGNGLGSLIGSKLLRKKKADLKVLVDGARGLSDYIKKKKLEATARKIEELNKTMSKSEGNGCVVPIADVIKKYGKGWI